MRVSINLGLTNVCLFDVRQEKLHQERGKWKQHRNGVRTAELNEQIMHQKVLKL